MSTFEQAVLSLLMLQTALILMMFIYRIVHGIHQAMKRARRSIQEIRDRHQQIFLSLDHTQQASPVAQEYQRWLEHPRIVLSQFRLTRGFYFEKVWGLRVLLSHSHEL